MSDEPARLTRETLPKPDSKAWRSYRKKVLTKMMPIDGPALVETREGPYTLPEGWKGFIALDSGNWPYPVVQEEADRMYELAAFDALSDDDAPHTGEGAMT